MSWVNWVFSGGSMVLVALYIHLRITSRRELYMLKDMIDDMLVDILRMKTDEGRYKIMYYKLKDEKKPKE